MSDDDLEIVESMEKYGGGFVKALAGAARVADSHNLKRLKEAFPEVWKGYLDLGRQMRTVHDSFLPDP